MAKLEYFLVAESVSVDQITNRVSIFNVIEEVRASKYPAHISMVAVSLWNVPEDDAGRDFQTVLEVTFPDGEKKEFRHNFKMPRRRIRTMFQLANLELKQPGPMCVDLALNGEHQATHTIDVVEVEPATD